MFVKPSTAMNGAGSQATVRHRVSQEEGKGQKSQILFYFLIDYRSPCCAGGYINHSGGGLRRGAAAGSGQGTACG